MKLFWLRITVAILTPLAIVTVVAAGSSRIVRFADFSILSGQRSVTVAIGGDIMLDRNIRKQGEERGYGELMSSLAAVFDEADIAVANLEGPVTTNPSKTLLADGSYGTTLHFTFAPRSLEALTTAGIGLVSLANNHSDNFYASGLAETKEWLAKSDIAWFGDPWNRISASTTYIWSKDGISIAFIGYHAFLGGFKGVLAEVRTQAEAGRFVIVMPHWGEEYEKIAAPGLRQQARQFIDAGAGAIIGSHPHVVMDHEWIGGVPVYYSLGNLLFDQYFSEDVRRGLIVKLEIVRTRDGRIRVEEITPYEIRNSSQNGASLL